MREGCEAFTSGWTEELEKVLINRKDDQTPINQLCYEISHVIIEKNFLTNIIYF